MAATASRSLNKLPCSLMLLCIFQTLSCIPVLTLSPPGPDPPGLFEGSDLLSDGTPNSTVSMDTTST